MKDLVRRGMTLSVGVGAAAILAAMTGGIASAATATMYDVDGNGALDPFVSDTSGNGIFDQNVWLFNGALIWVKDANEDSLPDQYGLDSNGDNLPDFWAMDANEDGTIDGYFYDSPATSSPGPFPDQWTSIERVLRSNPTWYVAPFGS